VGIPEDQIPDIYKPFHSTKKRGLGLGLAYCKRTVEAHGGEVMVDSVVGRGARAKYLSGASVNTAIPKREDL
jgi:signal transduction histidine kinase